MEIAIRTHEFLKIAIEPCKKNYICIILKTDLPKTYLTVKPPCISVNLNSYHWFLQAIFMACSYSCCIVNSTFITILSEINGCGEWNLLCD